jgi:hypothetical protein
MMSFFFGQETLGFREKPPPEGKQIRTRVDALAVAESGTSERTLAVSPNALAKPNNMTWRLPSVKRPQRGLLLLPKAKAMTLHEQNRLFAFRTQG